MQSNFLSPVLIVLVFVLLLMSIVAIFYIHTTAKNRERLALIEKGMNPNLARSDFWPQVGIIGGGFAFGLVLGDKLSSNLGPLLGVIFPGVGLVIYHFMRQSKLYKDR